MFWDSSENQEKSMRTSRATVTQSECSRRWMAFPVILAAIVISGMMMVTAATPVPKVTGPIEATANSYPFGAADHTRVPTDLKKVGYVEEEFFASGTANVYDWPEGGPAVVRTPNAPYTTRVLVRRPISRAKFSGNVIVEMLNPTNLFDLNIGWAISRDQIVRSGDVWVGITVKPISIVAVKNFNPERYAPLSFVNPLPLSDPQNCTEVARDSQRTTENGLSWDIFTQVGAWLRSRDRSNPLTYGVNATAKHPVQYLFAWGYSQTGMYLYTYINAIHPLIVQSEKKPPYDGYFIAVSNGPTAINQCAKPLPAGDPRRQIKDVGVPVVHIMSQSDYLNALSARRPDSDTAPDLYRHYELAGSGHATPDELNFAASPEDLIKAKISVPPLQCNEGPRSRFPSGVGFNAALKNLELWVIKKVPPPHADPIKVENGAPVLDKFGNVIGGIRTPYLDVPTSTWYGNSTGESFCRIAGHEVPFDKSKLKELYPSHKAYVDAVKKSVSALVAKGFIVREDGANLVEEAKRAEIP